MNLLPMDLACLNYLAECDGSAPTRAVPAKLFAGEIPEGQPNMVSLGLIQHRGDVTHITDTGRGALALASHNRGTENG